MAATQPPAGPDLTLMVAPALIETIAQRAAELVLEQLREQRAGDSPYMTVPEAAAYARCKRQRTDDLLSSRRLTRYKDGRRTLILKTELEAWLRGSSPRASQRPQPTQGWR